MKRHSGTPRGWMKDIVQDFRSIRLGVIRIESGGRDLKGSIYEGLDAEANNTPFGVFKSIFLHLSHSVVWKHNRKLRFTILCFFVYDS